MQNAQQCGHRKKCEKLKMRSNAPIGKKMRNAKCAAMWPSEKLRKIENTKQFAHWKKNEKCEMRSNVAKKCKMQNAQQCAHWEN